MLRRLRDTATSPDLPVGVVDAVPPDAQDLILQNRFVDPGLKAGDMLVMHSCLWHQAPPNFSGEDRLGIFNKYSALDAPSAAGPFPFNQRSGPARGGL